MHHSHKLTDFFYSGPIETCNECYEPTNVLKFSQSKRRKPLIAKQTNELAVIIDLNHFRTFKEIRKIA